MDFYGNPYLLDYHLMVSGEGGDIIGTHTDCGSINSDMCQGISTVEVGHTYTANLTIMEDDDGELYRFSKINEMVVTSWK
jgi:hypothetical protein